MKRLDKSQLLCKFGHHYNEYLGERWMGSCPMFECEYDGDIVIPDEMVCEENSKCPAYQPVETRICLKHDEEFFDVCGKCEDEMRNLAELHDEEEG